MFSDEIKYQLDFAERSKVFYLFANNDEEGLIKTTNELKHFLDNTHHTKISIVNYHECFSNQEHLKEIQEISKSYKDKEIFISSATSTKFDNFYHPLVNIFFWKYAKMRENVSWKSKIRNINLFSKQHYKDIEKSNKGILSVRKQTPYRDYLFSFLDNKNFEGILRYVKWIRLEEDEMDDYSYEASQFPTFLELINEYKKSYISFVIETEMTDFMNPLTEKTLVSFLTKTMPIVLGGKNYVKELKEMGFYVWNDEFGFDSDGTESLSLNKVDSYIKCIEQYNKMSKSEITHMYKLNTDKIEHNYKMVSEILFNKKKIL
jgi:hypothetical protein